MESFLLGYRLGAHLEYLDAFLMFVYLSLIVNGFEGLLRNLIARHVSPRVGHDRIPRPD